MPSDWRRTIDVEASLVRTLEVQQALEVLRRKIEIRGKFLAGQMDAVETELRVLEGDAAQRLKTLGPKIELARKQVASAGVKVEIGISHPIDLAQVKLRLQELQTEMAKAELDLQLVRGRIGQHRAGR